MTDDIKLPPLPEPDQTVDIFGHDVDLFTKSKLRDYARAAVLADRQQRADKLEALKRYVCDPRRVEYFDKTIHFTDGSAQAWKASFLMLDPLPDNYDRNDMDKPRLTPQQAFDRFIEGLE